MTKRRTVVAIIPVRELEDTKVRLSSVLTKPERAELTLAMLGRVISAIEKSENVRMTIMVCSEEEERLSRLVERSCNKIIVIPESKHHGGVNSAVEDGITCALERFGYVESIVVIPSDLPLLSGEVLDDAISKLDSFDFLIAPSMKRDGTNLLLFNLPQGRIPLHYDDDSYTKHLAAAKRLEMKYLILEQETLSFDVDSVEDYEKLKTGVKARSFAELISAIRNPSEVERHQ